MNTDVVLNLPGSSLQVLQASWRDLASLRELEQVCFPVDAWPLLDMIGVLTLPQVIRYKALEAQKFVGFVAGDIRQSQKIGWIATICVHPDYRGKGIGAALLKLCEEKMGMPKIKLSVREGNQAAIDLYKRNGYLQIGEWKKYYKGGENAVVMEKMIEKSN
ncbi:MAG: GNAT family N-acetyltransferase [Chloroflexota bacterium]